MPRGMCAGCLRVGVIQGDGLCEVCRDPTSYRCHHCQQPFPLPAAESIAQPWCNAYNFCETCAQLRIRTCTGCEYPVYDMEVQTVGGLDYCAQCFTEGFRHCQDCDTGQAIEETIEINGGDRIVCRNCVGNYQYCTECDAHLTGNNLCAHLRLPDPERIRPFNYKPEPLFFSEAGEETSLFFGFELEVEKVRHKFNAERISMVLDHPYLYPKRDGSLQQGFEVVSHPLSWLWLQHNRDNIRQILNGMKLHGCSSDDNPTTGFHVHMSRDAFTTMHLYKFMRLFYENPKWTVQISGRKDLTVMDRYSSINKEPVKDLMRKARFGEQPDRYVAINLANPHTVELRMFKGTITPSVFWRYMEICKATFDFTKEVGISEVNVTNFDKFVEKRRADYPHLAPPKQRVVRV